ncbi:capsid maturation protease and MuF-like fusion protein [Microbacterium phage GardenState]|uniref:Capsid maturation protease and MuF-like fusion protein n=1 Tax=Microbacterium phage GardenState TaxID=2776841 RepID=A0A7L8ZDB6_9CAUD|nr:capsid maturation protease and MuF-like fusion protein [Microbacterium phage GardenState]
MVSAAQASLAMARSHQAQQIAQAAAVQAALSELWDQTIDPNDVSRSFLLFREKAATLIGGGRLLSERKAAQYYSTVLAAKGLDPLDVSKVTTKPLSAGAIKGSLSAASSKSLARAAYLQSQGLPSAQALAAAKSNMLGSAKRQVLNAGRSRLTAMSKAHKGIRGWARVSDGNPCGFCAMLVGRGPVYSEDTVHFQAHDRCGCSARLVTWDDEDGGWSDDAKAYRWAYENGLLVAHTRGGHKNLSSAHWANGLTADDVIRLYVQEVTGKVAKRKAPTGLALPRLAAAESYEDAAKSVNPHFADNPDYQNNCHIVSAAMELRARGYNVQARPTIGAEGRYYPQMENDWRDASGKPRPFTNVEEAAGRKLAAGARLSKAIDELTADYPDGARGFIRGSWKTGGGHIWNWEKVDGKIVFYDGQPNDYTPEQVKGYLSRLKASQVSILRLDDMTPADRVVDLVTEAIEDTPVAHRKASIAYAEKQVQAARDDVARLRAKATPPTPSLEMPFDEYNRLRREAALAAAFADAIERGIPPLERHLAEYKERVAKLEAMAL